MRHSKGMKDSRGFTLVEMVVVLAVIAILAAVLTPIITSYVDRARHNAAISDLNNISSAITQFNTDMKFWPIYKQAFGQSGHKDPNGTADIYDVIYTNAGVDATLSTDWTTTLVGNGNTFDTVVNSNFYTSVNNSSSWKGPYFGFGADPWGTKYYLTASNLKPSGTNSAYLISAGPDQTINTPFSNAKSVLAPTGDDLIVQIK